MTDLTEEELQILYAWIDEIPLSRQKKNITRDFSDGVMAAEVVHHILPSLVELHNYTPANATQQKLDNWRTLNRKYTMHVNTTHTHTTHTHITHNTHTHREDIQSFEL